MMADPFLSFATELDPLQRTNLLSKWVEVFQKPVPPHLSTHLLRLSIAFELQSLQQGRASKSVTGALQKAGRPSASLPARRPRSGSRLVREWNGVTHVVEIVDGGYRYRDRLYTSLTAIAFEITGARWSGPRFFGLKARSSQ